MAATAAPLGLAPTQVLLAQLAPAPPLARRRQLAQTRWRAAGSGVGWLLVAGLLAGWLLAGCWLAAGWLADWLAGWLAAGGLAG